MGFVIFLVCFLALLDINMQILVRFAIIFSPASAEILCVINVMETFNKFVFFLILPISINSDLNVLLNTAFCH